MKERKKERQKEINKYISEVVICLKGQKRYE
jgi:hypothetical protein